MLEYGKMLERAGAVVQFHRNQGEVQNLWYNSIIIKVEYRDCGTGCSLNIVLFSKNVVIFLNSTSSAASLVFYLPGVCTHTDTEEKQISEYF